MRHLFRIRRVVAASFVFLVISSMSIPRSTADWSFPLMSNINYPQFTVSWITETETAGAVLYGKTPALGNMAYDIRGKDILSKVHYVPVTDLDANTLYYFDIMNNGVSMDNQGAHYTCRTARVPTSLPLPDTRCGQAVLPDGQTPAEHALVLITIQDNDQAGSPGESLLLSSLVDDHGWWCVQLSSAREGEGSTYFSYSQAGDAIQITSISPDGLQAEMTMNTSMASPLSPITLIPPRDYVTIDMELPAGWSMISLPVQPESLLLKDLFPRAMAVFRFNQIYQSVGENDQLEIGRGYWICLHDQTIYSITGLPIESYQLKAGVGWSMIGSCSWPTHIPQGAESIRAVFGFNRKYFPVEPEESLQPGHGYWLYHSDSTPIAMESLSPARR